MDQTQFSRQLIVLRAIINGYTGHARLFNCPTGQELELRVQTPGGMRALYAAVVERCEQGYRGCPLGALTVDERGQGTGAFSLAGVGVTPEILAVVEQSGDNCLLAMSGFLSGSRDVNWAGVRSAACEAVALNACSGCTPGIQPRDADSAATELPGESTSDEPEDDREWSDDARSDNRDDCERSDDSRSDDRDEDDNERRDDSRSDRMRPESNRHSVGSRSEASHAPVSAVETAGIARDCDWPEEIAALAPLFASQPAVTPFAGSRYTFIAVPASEAQPAFFAGIWATDGYPRRAAYAIRGDSPTLQPQGLEGFLWRPADDGGYWVTYIDAMTGQPVSGDY